MMATMFVCLAQGKQLES